MQKPSLSHYKKSTLIKGKMLWRSIIEAEIYEEKDGSWSTDHIHSDEIILKKPVLSSSNFKGYSWSFCWANFRCSHTTRKQANGLHRSSIICRTYMSISNLYLFIFIRNYAHVWYLHALIVKVVLKTSQNSPKFVFIKTFQIASY